MTQNLGAKQKNNPGFIHLESVMQRVNKGHFKWKALEGAEHRLAHALQIPTCMSKYCQPCEEERVDEAGGSWVCKSAFGGENIWPGAAWQVVGNVKCLLQSILDLWRVGPGVVTGDSGWEEEPLWGLSCPVEWPCTASKGQRAAAGLIHALFAQPVLAGTTPGAQGALGAALSSVSTPGMHLQKERVENCCGSADL